ncbi:MAG: hypothetical protein QW646_09000, partial [Ignisphaera sp.]
YHCIAHFSLGLILRLFTINSCTSDFITFVNSITALPYMYLARLWNCLCGSPYKPGRHIW